jgi:hypothetical protein
VRRNLIVFITSLFILITIAIFGCLVWANTHYSRNHPGEKNFFIPWITARTFLQYGENPYGKPATQRTQVLYYGNLVDNHLDPLQLSIPFPFELIYFPFALIPDYAFSRGLWMTCLEISIVLLAIISLRLTRWKPSKTLILIVLLFSIFWFYGFLSLVDCNFTIFIALALVVLLMELREGHDEFAGSLLVFPLLKFDFTAFFMVFILWWAIFHQRKRFLAGFIMTFTLLITISLFILSDWFLPFLSGWISHLSYNPGISPVSVFADWWSVFGKRLGWAVSSIMMIILFFEWRGNRGKDFRHLLWTVSLTLAATPLLGLPVSMNDYVILFFPLIHFISILVERWSRPGHWGIAGISIIILFFVLWFANGKFQFEIGLTPSPITALLFSLLLVVGLYWMRWWAIRPSGTWSDRYL